MIIDFPIERLIIFAVLVGVALGVLLWLVLPLEEIFQAVSRAQRRFGHSCLTFIGRRWRAPMPEPNVNFRRRQVSQLVYAIILTAAIAVAAVYRELALDPVLADGRRCALPAVNPFDLAYQVAEGATFCAHENVAAIRDLRTNGSAAILGSIAPAAFLFPLGFWVSGRILRRIDRIQRRQKNCYFCAERIRFEAKVCRYCGRDLPSDVVTQEKRG